MPDDFLVARNPEEGSSLPYLVRIPLGPDGIVLKARETWPRTSKVYCHRAEAWPADAQIVERVPTRVCTSRGAAIDLVLDRGRENRSQFVLARAKGRQVIFWQTPRTAKQARPNVRIPTARPRIGDGPPDPAPAPLEILVDPYERYAWRFSRQQATTRKAPLAVGDYAVELDGRVVAAVERKSLQDLSSSLLNGKLRFALGELSGLRHGAVVVEDRYSRVFTLEHVRPAAVADAIAESQARYPTVPILFCETRALAQEWTYRFLTAALHEARLEHGAAFHLDELEAAGPVPPREPTTAEVRAWALAAGLPVSDRGRLRPEVWDAYRDGHRAERPDARGP
ncbi:ERCC4 domain-containing protein [Intrasporangium sp.]|uniref:ERCC4 domain-containing protein n=1 Tax=Intrasporangium sp. TaxID=1925024 RepID=UPI00293A2FE4|nr:ERCC4 domain-containing protein [Intrasporangium sp.]MDV3220388.1 hypothetical protein [Intrasporangium sp.]